MFKNIFAAVAAVAMAVTPAAARVDAGTVALVNAVDASDIDLRIDTPYCNQNPDVHGVYRQRGLQRQLILCPGDTVDAGDHNTVRHEVAHAIQHCINAVRETHMDTPIVTDKKELMSYSLPVLGQKHIDHIQKVYPRKHWLVEIEANMMAKVFTASEIQEMFEKNCLYSE